MSIPVEVVDRLAAWNSSAYIYMSLGVVLLAASIVSSGVVTVFTEQLATKSIKICSFVAAVATALLATFNPMEIGFRFRDAWTTLDSALVHHKADEAKYPIGTVVEAMDRGQAILTAAPRPSAKPAETVPTLKAAVASEPK